MSFSRRILVLVGFLLLIALLFSSSLRGALLRVISPLTFLAEEISPKIASPFKTFSELGKLASQNKRLEEENLALKAENARLKEKETENELLRRQLNFNESQEHKFLIAKVVGRSPMGVSGSWLLNRGKKDGVTTGALVVAEGYLLGQVKSVFERTSLLELVISHRLLIPVILGHSRVSGLLRGGLQGLVIEEIPLDTQVKIEEEVVTYGFEGIPEGVLVGKVKEVKIEKGAIFQKVLVETPLKFSQIEVVSVVQK